jgi:hypothetical protein
VLPAFIAHTWISRTKNSYPEVKYLTVLILCFSAGLALPKYDLPFMLMEKQRQAIYMAQGGSYLTNHETKKFVYISAEIKKRIVPLEDRPGFCKIAPGVSYIAWNLENFLDSSYVEHSADTNTYWIFYDQEPAGSYIKIPGLDGTFGGILRNAPAAFGNTFLRPYLFEAKNPLMMLSALENSAIVFIGLICILFCYRSIPNRHLIYFCLTITILLFALIGLTTPVMGAAVRYKIPALPLLLIAFLLLLDKEKLLKKYPFLK